MKNITALLPLTIVFFSGCGILCNPTYTPTGKLVSQDLSNEPIRLQVEDPRKENEKVFYTYKVLGLHTDYLELSKNAYVKLQRPSCEIIKQSLNDALNIAGYKIVEDAPISLNVMLLKFLAVSPDTWGPQPHRVTADIELDVAIKKSGIELSRKRISEHVAKEWDAFHQYEDSEVVLSSCLSNVVEKTASDNSILNAVKRGYGIELPEERAESEETKQPPESSIPRARSQREIRTGTAFAVSDAGHLISSYHVMKDANEIRVKFEGQDYIPATLQRYSLSNDIALLKIDQPTSNYLSFADFRTVRQGQKVFTLGYPVTQVLGTEPKYSEGTISSLSGIMGEYSLIQISVPVQPGNSGGPLVNTSGDVIGMITSTAAVQTFFAATGTLPQNVNWAVKADYIIPLLPKGCEKESDTESEAGDTDTIAHVRKSICLIEAK
jgi:S1-C subfamily serine protease